jgi:hypothetical protein
VLLAEVTVAHTMAIRQLSYPLLDLQILVAVVVLVREVVMKVVLAALAS